MSAIGEYVHYHANNYITYGINHSDGEKSSIDAVGGLVAAQRAIMMNSYQNATGGFTDADKDLLERNLSWLMMPPSSGNNLYSGTGLSEKDFNKVWGTLLGFMYSEYQSALDIISRETVNATGIYLPGLHSVKTNKAGTSYSVKGISDSLQAIQNAFHNGGYSTEEMKKLKHWCNRINTELEKMGAEANQSLANISSGKRISVDKAQPFVDIINEAMAYSSGLANIMKGELFEMMVAVAPFIGNNMSKKAIKDALKTVVGTERTKVTFDPNDFPPEARTDAYMKTILGKNYKKDINSHLWTSTNATQDKVDVNVQMSPNRSVATSVKNIALTGTSGQIKIVDSFSLLMALVTLNNNEIATHYINQHVIAIDNGEEGTRAKTNQTHYTGVYSETAKLLKLSIIENALQGYKKDAKKAESFIINDTSGKKLYIVNMADLLIKICNSLNNGKDINEYAAGLGVVDTASFDQAWGSSWGDRISKILSKVHSYKITVHLKSNIFRI